MDLETLTEQIKKQPQIIEFDDVMAVVANQFEYTPTQFSNGHLVNEAGTNEGSCKIFALAQHLGLNETETLNLFGKFYRDDVLGNPEGSDHGNIRNFVKTGWKGIQFNQSPLVLKG